MSNILSFKNRRSREQRFDAVVRPHFQSLYRAARRMTLSPHDAEDLVQDTCIRAFEQLDKLEGFEYPRAWLMRVLYNRFVDLKRSTVHSPLANAGTGDESDEPEFVASGEDGPETLIDRDQEAERILKAMRCLDSELCALVAMHDIEGISLHELSAATGKPVGTIKAQLHRTRKKLGRLLSATELSSPTSRAAGENP